MIVRGAVCLSVLLILYAGPSEAASYYLKADCANNGTGAAAGCAASGGAAGAWNSVANANTGWAAVCAAGDILYVRAKDDASETIASDNNDDPRWHGGLRVGCSGTAGNLTTITNYPGEIGRLANGAVGCSEATCDNFTISSGELSYTRIGSTDGLYNTNGRLIIRGGIVGHGTASAGTQQGVVIVGNEITTGWEYDGNLAGIRIEDLVAPWVHHNYIHDVITLAGGTNASSGSGIKIYRSAGSVIEYNRIDNVCDTDNCGPDVLAGNASQAGGIDDKDGSINNIHRYNYISEVPTCLRFQNQGATMTGTQAYGNVCERGTVVDTGACMKTEAGSIDDALVHHNTCAGWGWGVFVAGAFNGSGGFTFRDNILADTSAGSPFFRIFHDDGGSFALADFNAATDYNAYDSDADYQVDGTSTDIAAWRTASSRDANSTEAATVCGGFSAGSDTNFHIASGACLTGSSTGGEQGAYGVTSCVGHLCGSADLTPRRLRFKIAHWREAAPLLAASLLLLARIST